MGLRESESLTLRVYDTGDTSQVAHLLTPDTGKIHVLAKGSRRDRNAFQGPLDLLVRGRAGWYPRPRTGLHLLGTFEVLDTYPAARTDLGRYYVASHVLEALHEATRQEEPDERTFRLGVATLSLVARAPEPRAVLPVFHADLLRRLGTAPRTEVCVGCGKEAARVERPRLSPVRGGLLCEDCAPGDRSALDLSPSVLRWTTAVLDRSFREGVALELPDPVAGPVSGLLSLLLRHTLERDLPSLKWIR
jgi:DNA repair protein RecO (recombination protein O)